MRLNPYPTPLRGQARMARQVIGPSREPNSIILLDWPSTEMSLSNIVTPVNQNMSQPLLERLLVVDGN